MCKKTTKQEGASLLPTLVSQWEVTFSFACLVRTDTASPDTRRTLRAIASETSKRVLSRDCRLNISSAARVKCKVKSPSLVSSAF